MAATMLGSLLVSLGLDSAQFKSGLTDAERRAQRAGKSFDALGRRSEALGRTVGNSIKTLGALALGGGLASVVKSSFEYASSLAEVAQQLGVTTDALQEFRYVGSQVGLTQQEMDMSLSQLTRRLGEAASGTKAQAEAFSKLGVSVRDSNGNVINAAQAIPLIADALKSIKTPAEQAAILVDLFGKAGMKMLPALLQGSAGINSLRQAAHQLGIVLSAETINKADETADKLASLGQVLNAKIAATVTANSEAIIGLANALVVLVDNIGSIAKVGAIIAGAFGVRWIASFAAATVSTVGLRLASLTLIGTLGGLAAAARAVGAALLAAFGGPVGVAILAIGAAMFYVSSRGREAAAVTAELTSSIDEQSNALGTTEAQMRNANAQTGNLTDVQRKAIVATANLTGEAHLLANAWARVAAEAKAAAIAIAEATLDKARSNRIAASGAFQRANASPLDQITGSVPVDNSAFSFSDRFSKGKKLTKQSPLLKNVSPFLVQKESRELDQAVLNEAAAQKNLDEIRSRKLASFNAATAATGTSQRSGSSGGSGRGGSKSAQNTAAQFDAELAGLAQQTLSSNAGIAKSAEERAELELRSVELARTRTIADVKRNEEYSAVQKMRLTEQVEALAQAERDRVEFQKQQQLEQERQQLSDEQYRGEQDALRLQYDMAETQAERKKIALDLLALENRYQRSMLEAVLASETASNAEKKRAKMALDFLTKSIGSRAAQAARQNETPVEQYLRSINQTPAQINEAIDDIKIDGLNALNQGLVDAIMGVKSLGDMFRAVASQIIADLLRISIQKAIIGPLAGLLFGGGGAAASVAGGIGAGIGGFPGFAKGTNFAPRGIGIVGEEGPEFINFRGGEKVFPNGVTPFGMTSGTTHSPTFVFPGITDARGAREAAGQAARRYRMEMNGPIRGI